MRQQKGFSLIELLIVVAIILIIAAIAIPSLVGAKMAANEASAANSIRTINAAQVSYQSIYAAIGYSNSLVALGPSRRDRLSRQRSGRGESLPDRFRISQRHRPRYSQNRLLFRDGRASWWSPESGLYRRRFTGGVQQDRCAWILLERRWRNSRCICLECLAGNGRRNLHECPLRAAAIIC